jgi:hypothetical protein
MALINTTTTGVLGSTFYGDGAGALTVQKDGVTQGIYGNIPMSRAYVSGNQNYTTNTWTKAQFNTKSWDTNNNFSTSNYRFTPTVAGYYQLSSAALLYSASSNITFVAIEIYKNGSSGTVGVGTYQTTPGSTTCMVQVADVVYANGTTDYFEVWIYSNGTSPYINGSTTSGYFNSFLVKAA